MSAVAERGILRLEDFGELTPISRAGGQGRVYRPALVPPAFGSGPIVVKRWAAPRVRALLARFGQ